MFLSTVTRIHKNPIISENDHFGSFVVAERQCSFRTGTENPNLSGIIKKRVFYEKIIENVTTVAKLILLGHVCNSETSWKMRVKYVFIIIFTKKYI